MGKAAEAAAELEQAFSRCMPAERKKRLDEAAWTAALKKFHEEARQIRRRHALGVLGRARAAYLLQQRLVGAGFPADAVRQVVFALIVSAFSGKE